ncbi:MAG: hypothetical protein Q8L07_04280, partial [Sediminibacterium sp.]|nr:hypothetical protein [Sediminibacterium sp.]
MKKILVILSILGCFTASAQQPSVTPQLFKYDYYKFMGYLASDSGLMLPIRTPNFTPVRAGMSVFNTADTTLHIWSGYNWHPMATQAWVSSIKKIDNQYGSTLSAQTAKFWISDTVKAPVFIATDHVATDSIKSSNRHAVYVGDTLSFYIDSANQVTIGSHEYANSSAGGGRVLTVAGTNNPARGAPHASLELVSAETDRNDSLTSGYYPARIHYTAHTNDSLGSDRRVIAAADAWRSGPTARARGGNWGVFTRQDASQGNGSPELLALWVDRYQTVKSLYNATVGQNLTVTGSIYGTIATPAQPNITSVGTLSGLTVTNPINGSVTGNAGTATALQTARNINGTSFDGSTDITLLVNAN